ncbi:prepilin peptidase [Candidatus Villigracilis affinis]|uniref:prepilin peptidase n=1 Tax=Candidatus Villigracilis affinis TaxID=3140682 RepID=UPI001E0D0434|nr:prepilin peptidase [Anaerolineales bacterium]
MWSSNIFPVYGLLLSVLIIGGVQDWRTGEVSNWISIPLFSMGAIAPFLRLFLLDNISVNILSIFVMGVITYAAIKGWMGGADWKVLVGLFGLWPLAGFAALVVAGVWGGIIILKTGDRNRRFPGVTAFAFAACLTLF